MSVKRFIPACLLITSLILSACGLTGNPADTTTDPAAGETVTISFAAQEFERATYEPLIESFNAENPDVQVRFVSPDEISATDDSAAFDPEQMMRQMVTAADTASVFFIRDEDIQGGLVRDLNPLMEADADFDRDDFFPGALSVDADGGIYLLPRVINVPLLSYNKDLWAAAGLAEPDPNWSWNDMIGAAEQLAQKRGDEVDVYGLMTPWNGVIELLAELEAVGVNPFTTPAEQIRLDTPEVIGALERIANLAESGAIYVNTEADTAVAFNPDDFQTLIRDQQVAIWQPEMLMMGGTADEEPPFATGTLPFPTMSLPFFSNAQGYVMSGGTQHPEAAWRWLAFLSRQNVDNQVMSMGGPGQVPARRSLADQSGYWDDLDAETRTAVETVLERPVPPLPAGIFNNQNLFEILNEASLAVMSGEKTAEQALIDAQGDLTERLAEAALTPEPTPDTGPIVVATPAPDVVPEGATTVTFAASGFQAGDVRRLAREFNQNNPDVFVQVSTIDFSEGPVEFNDIAAANDCFAWGGLPGTDEMTATLDLQPLIDADPTFASNDFPAVFLESFRQGTALYGLPYAVRLQALAYNQEAFEAAGLAPPTADWTLDDFVNAAQQLTTEEGRDQQYGFASVGGGSQDLFFFADRRGTSLVQGSGDELQPNYTAPEVVEAIRFYMDLIRDYSPQDKLYGYRQNSFDNETFQLVNEGQVGMWFSSGLFFTFGNDNEEFTQAAAPPPFGDSAVTPNDFSVRGLYVSATTEQPEACWTWIKHFSNLTDLLQGDFPARISTAESPAFTEDAQPGALDVYNAYRNAFERNPNMDLSQSYQQSHIDFFWLFQAIDRAMQGEDLERELADAQSLTEQYLACIRGGEEEAACATQVDPDYEGFSQPEEEDEE